MRTYLRSLYYALVLSVFFPLPLTIKIEFHILISSKTFSYYVYSSRKDISQVKVAYCIPPTCNGVVEDQDIRPRTALTLEDPFKIIETI